jgi:hypothetical protein
MPKNSAPAVERRERQKAEEAEVDRQQDRMPRKSTAPVIGRLGDSLGDADRPDRSACTLPCTMS